MDVNKMVSKPETKISFFSVNIFFVPAVLCFHNAGGTLSEMNIISLQISRRDAI